MQLITTLLLTASVVSAHPLYARQDAGYPSPSAVGPTPRPEWVAKLNEAKSAGLIPTFAPSNPNGGGTPYYAAGTDTGPGGVCSWTASHCVNDDELFDVLNAPPGMFGVTFDDGPTPATSALIDFLQEQRQSSTHFVIGGNIVYNEAQFMQMVDAGAHIAVHTWSHPYLTTLTDEEIVGELGWTSQIIFDKSGFVPKWVRAPYGDVDNRVRAIAREVFGLEHFVSWKEDSSDWCLSDGGGSSCAPGNGPQSGADLDTFFDRILTDSKENGLILLEHEQNGVQVAAFQRNYHKIAEQGWDARSIPDLWAEAWYLNAANAQARPSPSVEIGSGPVDTPVNQNSDVSSSQESSIPSMSSTSSSMSTTSAPLVASASSSLPSTVYSATDSGVSSALGPSSQSFKVSSAKEKFPSSAPAMRSTASATLESAAPVNAHRSNMAGRLPVTGPIGLACLLALIAFSI